MAAECKGLGGFGFKNAAALLHYKLSLETIRLVLVKRTKREKAS